MKKPGAFFACLVLVFGLFVVNAHAVDYSSWVEAQTNLDYEDGYTYAYASDGDQPYMAYAEAAALGWDIGGRSYIWLSGDQASSIYTHASSTVTQEFKVTAAGPASIDFAWGGIVGITGTPTTSGEYYVNYTLYVGDNWSNGFNYGDGFWNVMGSTGVVGIDSLTYNFSASDVGSIISVAYSLETTASVSYLGFADGGAIALYSTLMQGGGPTGVGIFDVTGGLTALGEQVPLPGALLLLSSGLLGLVGFARKRRIQ